MDLSEKDWSSLSIEVISIKNIKQKRNGKLEPITCFKWLTQGLPCRIFYNQCTSSWNNEGRDLTSA